MNLKRPIVAVLFLLLCLVTGWLLAEIAAPKPVIGLLRLDGGRIIDTNEAERLVSALAAAEKNDQVAAIVLEIDTPGGSAISSELIQEAILRVRQIKPVVASVTGMATSGGYLVAVATDMIYASPSAAIGSVGAITMQPGDPTLPPGALFTGPYKPDGGSRFDQIRQLDIVKQSFAGGVIALRSRAPNPINIDMQTLTEARVYLGREALTLGLIDFEGSRLDAVQAAADLAGVRHFDLVELDSYLLLPDPTPTPENSVPFFSALDQQQAETILFSGQPLRPRTAAQPPGSPQLCAGPVHQPVTPIPYPLNIALE